MTKTLLALPTYDGKISVHLAPFLNEKTDVVIFPIEKFPTDVARNLAVAHAQHGGMNLIMCDSDAVPAPNSWQVLVDKISSEVCVAGCPYVSSGGHVCVGEKPPSVRDVEHLEGWHRVDNIGCHLVAYNVEVWSAIKPPYFEYEYNQHHTSHLSEDIICHRKLHNANIPIWCNWSLWASHMTVKKLDKPRTLSENERMLAIMGL
jgi:hypothetical protein